MFHATRPATTFPAYFPRVTHCVTPNPSIKYECVNYRNTDQTLAFNEWGEYAAHRISQYSKIRVSIPNLFRSSSMGIYNLAAPDTLNVALVCSPSLPTFVVFLDKS